MVNNTIHSQTNRRVLRSQRRLTNSIGRAFEPVSNFEVFRLTSRLYKQVQNCTTKRFIALSPGDTGFHKIEKFSRQKSGVELVHSGGGILSMFKKSLACVME